MTDQPEVADADAERLPCPFCAEDKLLLLECLETSLGLAYRIRCGNCGASSGLADYSPNAEAWNTRATAEAITALKAENERLTGELSAAVGYLMNAQIDLETGCTKATALRTIAGGIARARTALTPS